MRLIAIASGLLMAGMLSACGGGTASGGPAPTPPPPATDPVNTTLTNLQFNEAFDGRGAINRFSINKATADVTTRQTLINRQVAVRYDANARSYTISAGDLPDTTFALSDRIAAESTAVITTYGKSSGNRTDSLALLNPGPANTQIALTYASYGGWQSTVDNGSTIDASVTFFTFGVKTAPGDLPTTGSATYATVMDGLFAGTSEVYVLSGTSSFSADFGAGTVAFSMTPTGTNILDASTKSFGTLNGTGTISSATTSFTAATPAGSGYGASLLGKFYGPGAAEMGSTFLLTGPDGQGTGVIIGKKN